MSRQINSVVITGVTGNLGWKLLLHLIDRPEVQRLTGIAFERPSSAQLQELVQRRGHEKARFVEADLTDHTDVGWRDAIERSDAVVHFAAQNPFPEADWNDAVNSLDMTLATATAAVSAGVKRFVFASSNHVMGRYKDRPLHDSVSPGELTTSLAHAVGTVWNAAGTAMDSTVYAVAKSSGERVCRALAVQSAGATEFVCTRIGWCQPGQNLPATLSSAGTPTQDASGIQDDPDAAWNDRWFRSMWLSNRDCLQIHSQALFADSSSWPEPCVVVNAMSRNEDMLWSLQEAKQWLGYQPQDGIVF